MHPSWCGQAQLPHLYKPAMQRHLAAESGQCFIFYLHCFDLSTHFPFYEKIPHCHLISNVINIVLLWVARLSSSPHITSAMYYIKHMHNKSMERCIKQHCFPKNSSLLSLLVHHLDFIKIVKTFCKGTAKWQSISKPIVKKCQSGETFAFKWFRLNLPPFKTIWARWAFN